MKLLKIMLTVACVLSIGSARGMQPMILEKKQSFGSKPQEKNVQEQFLILLKVKGSKENLRNLIKNHQKDGKTLLIMLEDLMSGNNRQSPQDTDALIAVIDGFAHSLPYGDKTKKELLKNLKEYAAKKKVTPSSGRTET